MKFYQIQTIPVVQLDFSWVCHNYWLLLKSLPLMLKVRGPPQWPPLIISNGMEVDFQTVGSLTQQGSGSPGLLTPTCRETQPYALAHYSATGNQLDAGFIVCQWLCQLWIIFTLLRNSNVPNLHDFLLWITKRRYFDNYSIFFHTMKVSGV